MLSSRVQKASDNENQIFRSLLKAVSVIVVLTVLVMQSAFSDSQQAFKSLSPAWQEVLASLPKNEGVFNSALRRSVRENVSLVTLSMDHIQDSQVLTQKLIPRLELLDKELSKYVRVSESASRFEQLKRLMPGLYNIEERKLIEFLLKRQGVSIPRLRNSRLLGILDKRISLLANGMIFNMKALVRERRDYEADLLKSMSSYGVAFSARPPDFILDYQLDDGEQNEHAEWMFNARITLLGKYEIPVVKVQEVLITDAATKAEAQSRSVEILAKLITMQLKQYLVDYLIEISHKNGQA
ncbi:MAG: hypothetical protein U9N57_02140 [Pseudomonadota bacterium]|nr:hypothetical protein [Pseudomonadota bacterium]